MMQAMQKVAMIWILTQRLLYPSSPTSGSCKLFLLVLSAAPRVKQVSQRWHYCRWQGVVASCLPRPELVLASTTGGRPGLQSRPVGQRWRRQSQHLHYYYCTTPNSIQPAISPTHRIKENKQTFQHKDRKF